MKARVLARRTILRGLTGAPIALPFLEAMGLGAGAAPKRLLIFGDSDGTAPGKWKPTYNTVGSTDAEGRVDGKILKMSPMLEALEPFKDRIIQFRGVHLLSEGADYDGHNLDHRHIFTVANPIGSLRGPLGGISIDQEVAQKVGGSTKLRSLSFVIPERTGISWTAEGPNKPVAPLTTPQAGFAKVFGGTVGAPAGPTMAEILAYARKKSVLDTIKGDYGRLLAKRLGKEDHTRVQNHLDSLREIERNVDALKPGEPGAPRSGATCDSPTAPGGGSGSGIYDKLTAFFDIMAKAVECDVTRVAVLQMHNIDQITVPGWGPLQGKTVSGDWHNNFSHGALDNNEIASVQHHHAQHFAAFLAKLDAIREGDGTALDNSIVLWTNELNDGGSHTHADTPWLMAGTAGGYFKSGRFIDYCTKIERARNPDRNYNWVPVGGVSHGRLFVSILNALGVPTTTFGMPQYSNGPLGNLT